MLGREGREFGPRVAAAAGDLVASQTRRDGVLLEELLARLGVAADERGPETFDGLLLRQFSEGFLASGERGLDGCG